MPEGPEVETIRTGLLPVIDQQIKEVKVSNHKKYQPKSEITQLKEKYIHSIDRYGKFLVWEFSTDENGIVGLNHMGMTGVWYHYSDEIWNQFDDPFQKYKHWKVYFRLDDNSHLLFVNVRTFGRFEVMTKKELHEYPAIKNLGPDILSDNFNVDEFIQRVKGKHRPRTKSIGKCLLDYTIVAGCGNIYKNEGLYMAKIHPMTSVSDLDAKELEQLASALTEVAQKALKFKGSTLQDYRHVDGYEGLMQDKFKVYNKEGDDCERCGSIIVSGSDGNRTSFWCPNCQSKK